MGQEKKIKKEKGEGGTQYEDNITDINDYLHRAIAAGQDESSADNPIRPIVVNQDENWPMHSSIRQEVGPDGKIRNLIDITLSEEQLAEIDARRAREAIVVDGAQITCDCAGGKMPNFLKVNEGHGALHNGKLVAHEGTCFPVKNIDPFEYCTSPGAKEALKILYEMATGDDKKKYEDAYNKAVSKSLWASAKAPCTRPLLNRWFDADEKEVVIGLLELDTTIETRVKQMTDDMLGAVKTALKYLIYHTGEESYSVKRMKSIREELKSRCKAVEKVLNTKIQPRGHNFKAVISQLSDAIQYVEEIKTQWMDAYKFYNKLVDYELHVTECDNILALMEVEKNKIANWKEMEKHLITVESFLVCRCGGIITFKNSGQDALAVADKLALSLLATVRSFKDFCAKRSEYKASDSNLLGEWRTVSDKKAAEGLEIFEKMLAGGEDKSSSMEVSIYVEFICHSFNVEENKTLMAALSLLCLGSTGLSVALAFYTLVETANSPDAGEGSMDDVSAVLTAHQPFVEASAELAASNTIGAVYKLNSAYTVFASISNLVYVSYDSYVENIRVTVFTEAHAHIKEQVLNQDGTLKEDNPPILHDKNSYTGGNLGRGLKWKEEPGVYMKRLIHEGDNVSVEGTPYGEEEAADVQPQL